MAVRREDAEDRSGAGSVIAVLAGRKDNGKARMEYTLHLEENEKGISILARTAAQRTRKLLLGRECPAALRRMTITKIKPLAWMLMESKVISAPHCSVSISCFSRLISD